MPIFSKMVRGKFYVKAIKPFFDTFVAVILITFLLPLLILIGIIMSIDLRRSPLFTQVRVGRDDQLFSLHKFRTMRVDDDEKTTTRLGKFLRSISMDELLQLINILKGEMSFVGPRPLLSEYLPYYNEQEKIRHSVKPGITGWAQVNGRNSIDWGERMEKDVVYVKQVSLVLDFKIVLLTFLKLLKRDRTPYKNDTTIKFSEYASKR